MPAVQIGGRVYEEIAVKTKAGSSVATLQGLSIPAHD